MRKAFENGELINLRFLFGYSITADGVQINEKEAAIVREIFSRFNGGEMVGGMTVTDRAAVLLISVSSLTAEPAAWLAPSFRASSFLLWIGLSTV